MVEQDKIGVVFPGQGSQIPGMGKDFFDKLPICRQTYEEASDALGWDIAAMCFGEDGRLNLTQYTQPCIVTTEVAMMRGLKELFGFESHYFGGHSLGEYAALVVAGVWPLKDAAAILQERGRLMQEAVPVGKGGMMAVIGEKLDASILSETLRELPVDVANVNSLKQIVISGDAEFMAEAESRLSERLGKDQSVRFVTLNVSAPFHSRFMSPISGDFEEFLRQFTASMVPENAQKVTSNYTGGFHEAKTDTVIYNLVQQLNHAVQWVDNMKALSSCAGKIYEVGPGRPLRAFFQTLNMECTSLTTLSAAERLFIQK
ncbi:MAG: ACP S-malonyltransferase [Syntrophobacterales bacterium]|jgi:[acyl-carrier-protein] S-malonyltransferase/trans-AT polyketide synthase/acyltransferase/oxidoreductase domain-containing protein|nr:ACP S-malonyltransferase [Syntrophobacterales bacterium]